MIRLTDSGSFKNTEAWLTRLTPKNLSADWDKYGRMGVSALQKATPIDDGDTRGSWSYKVTKTAIEWHNSHVNDGAVIAILIQYGHGTGTGGYVAGRDYINPAIKPIFDQIAADIWKKVTNG